MCQKAFGSFFAPLTGVPRDKFEVTRGTLAIFMSSDQAERGFCANCGTPLTFHYVGRPRIAVSIGSLDEPAKVKPHEPVRHRRRACRGSPSSPRLPGDKTTEDDDAGARRRRSRDTNHQHPDHDTADWPPTA